jgi:hypothetical protein
MGDRYLHHVIGPVRGSTRPYFLSPQIIARAGATRFRHLQVIQESVQVARRATRSSAGLDARFTFERTIQRNQECSRLAHTFARKAAFQHRAGRASSATADRLGHHAPKYQRGSRTCERPCNRHRFEAFGGTSAAIVRYKYCLTKGWSERGKHVAHPSVSLGIELISPSTQSHSNHIEASVSSIPG